MLRRLPFLILPLFLAACAARSPLAPVPFDMEEVSQRHRAAFEGLVEALESQENRRAENLVDGLIARLEDEVDSGDAALESEVTWQLRAAQRFKHIVQGRERLSSLDMGLHVVETGSDHRLVLRIKSRWPGELLLSPGPAILDHQALSIGPGGERSEQTRSRVVEGLSELELEPLALLEVDLGTYRRWPLGGALAQRETFVLRMGAGGLEDDERLYPAQDWPAARGLRVSLAAFLPNGILDPSELLTQVESGSMGMPGLVERTIRISPDRYKETLLAMRGPVSRATPEMFSRMEPLLRWLCSHDPQPSGLEGWRAHLARLSQG